MSVVKDVSSEIQIGISSGEWIEPDLEKRINYIKSWQNIPDFISVNMIEDNAIEVSKHLVSKGVFIEAGLNEKEAAIIFVESNLEKDCCRILIEPEPEELDSAINVINEIEEVLNQSNIKIPRLLHGFNSLSWEILREAKRRGYNSRIGMEDTIYLGNGKMVKSNLDLIQYADNIVSTE